MGERTVSQKLLLTYIHMKFFPSFGVENSLLNFVHACQIHPIYCTSYCKFHNHSLNFYPPHFVPGPTANKSMEQGPCIVINPSDSQKIPYFSQKPKVFCHVYKSALLFCILDKMNRYHLVSLRPISLLSSHTRLEFPSRVLHSYFKINILHVLRMQSYYVGPCYDSVCLVLSLKMEEKVSKQGLQLRM